MTEKRNGINTKVHGSKRTDIKGLSAYGKMSSLKKRDELVLEADPPTAQRSLCVHA